MEIAESSLSLRERKHRRTERAIIRAAAELTLEESFAAATIPRIAERAEVAPRTVSRCFPVKDEILFARTAEHIERARRHFERGQGDTIERLQAWFGEEIALQAGDLAKDTELERLKLRAIEHDPELRAVSLQHLDAIRGLVSDSIVRDIGGSPSGLAAQVLSAAVMGMFTGLQSSVQSTEPRSDLTEELDRVLVFLRSGLETLRVDPQP
jgi:AcrR family transcriptional regulator